MTLNDPQARLRDMDRMGLDAQMLFPSTLYAHMTPDPGFEAALFRAYNRYLGAQCQQAPKRLTWSGLLPLRDRRQAFEALEEMQRWGARANSSQIGRKLGSESMRSPAVPNTTAARAIAALRAHGHELSAARSARPVDL